MGFRSTHRTLFSAIFGQSQIKLDVYFVKSHFTNIYFTFLQIWKSSSAWSLPKNISILCTVSRVQGFRSCPTEGVLPKKVFLKTRILVKYKFIYLVYFNVLEKFHFWWQPSKNGAGNVHSVNISQIEVFLSTWNVLNENY